MPRRRSTFLRPFLLLLLSLISVSTLASRRVEAQWVSVSGWLNYVWTCGPSTGANTIQHIPRYSVTDAQGRITEIVFSSHQFGEIGGPAAAVGKWVTVTGSPVLHPAQGGPAAPAVQASSVRFTGKSLGANASQIGAQAVTGNRRYVTIMVRFSDTVNASPVGSSHFAGLFGSTYPGLDHYYREISSDQVNLAGGTVVGWYNLPQPQSAYMSPDASTVDFSRVLNDAVAAADGDIFFPDYAGINVIFNVQTAWFWGGGFTLNRDGQNKAYGITWCGYNASQAIMAHEIGHSMGLPHSSGPYTQVYDSRWDVMSGGGGNPDATYGNVACGTISYHKDLLGWIPANRRFVASPGTQQTITLDRLNQPASSANYLMAVVPIFGLTELYYTVEARNQNGYDSTIPGPGVVIHLVDPSRVGASPALVYDLDNNGNPNDASARWTVGETFDDAANNIRISVQADTGSGFTVSILNDGIPSETCGLNAVYYDNVDLTGTTVTRLEPTVYYNFGLNGPVAGIGADTFSARWTGIITAPTTGAYTFFTQTDDGVRLWVNNLLLIDRWTDQNPTEWSAQIPLIAGQEYDIRMEYYDRNGSAMAKLLWTPPGSRKGHIPPSVICGEPPAAPSNLTATTLSAIQIRLDWTDNSLDEGAFLIERRTPATAFAQVASTSADVTTYTDGNLLPGTTYTYRLRASNGIGESDYSNEASATTLLAPPEAPTNLQVTVLTSTKLRLTWSDNTAIEAGYEVERRSGAASFARIATLPIDTNTFVDTGLATNTLYTYQVRAVNAAGASLYSNTASGTPVPTLPAAPGGLGATAQSHIRVTLGWQDRSFNEEQFRIERKTGSGEFSLLSTPTANATAALDNSVVPGTTYTYRIRAANEDGTSAWSNESTVTTPFPPPVGPDQLTATAPTFSRVELAWRDQSADEEGFRIERKTGTGQFAQIATVPANVATYVDANVDSNTQYTYRVRAFNQNGNSTYSNDAGLKTPPNLPAPASGLVVTALSSTQVRLIWIDGSTNETGFRVERRIAVNGTWTGIASLNTGVTSYIDASVVANTAYTYRVVAFNNDGDAAPSNEAGISTEPVPTSPASLTASVESLHAIRLSWTDRSSNEAGFRIERRVGTGGYAEHGSVGAGVTTFVDQDVEVRTTYSYRLRAFNAGGTSLASNAVSVSIFTGGKLVYSPRSLRFPLVKKGKAVKKTILLRNVGSAPLSGTVISAAAPFTLLSGGGSFNLPARGRKSVVVQFAPGAAGAFTDFIHITSTDTNKESNNLLVTGRGR